MGLPGVKVRAPRSGHDDEPPFIYPLPLIVVHHLLELGDSPRHVGALVEFLGGKLGHTRGDDLLARDGVLRKEQRPVPRAVEPTRLGGLGSAGPLAGHGNKLGTQTNKNVQSEGQQALNKHACGSDSLTGGPPRVRATCPEAFLSLRRSFCAGGRVGIHNVSPWSGQ